MQINFYWLQYIPLLCCDVGLVSEVYCGVIHPKTLLIGRHFYSLESYVWKSIYNLKIDTISTYDTPLDRSFLKLWNGIRHVMPSTDRRLELKEKTSMAQNAWQAFVYANGLTTGERSEKCIVRRFRHCANVTECTYTDLDSIAYYTPTLYGIAYCS